MLNLLSFDLGNVPFYRDIPRRSGATVAKIEPNQNVALVAFAAVK